MRPTITWRGEDPLRSGKEKGSREIGREGQDLGRGENNKGEGGLTKTWRGGLAKAWEGVGLKKTWREGGLRPGRVEKDLERGRTN